jgi:hypothetical protein
VVNNTNKYVASYYSIRVILLTSCSSFSDFGEAERFPWLLPFISSITVAMATQIRNQHSLIFPIWLKELNDMKIILYSTMSAFFSNTNDTKDYALIGNQ